MKALLVGAALLALGGCATFEIDEGDVFAPQPFDASKQVNGAEILGEDAFTKAINWRYAVEGNGEHAVFSGQKETFVATGVTHGRLSAGQPGSGGDQIAWTMLTRGGDQRPLIVRCLGNAGTRQRNGLVYGMTALPYGDVLMFDYPGSGQSGGEASTAQFEAMLQSVLAFAREKATGRKLVFWGHSLGGFVCGEMAKRAPETVGVVFETTARNAREVANEWTPWYVDPFVKVKVAPSLAGFDNADAMKGFRGPVLVLGAKKDRTLKVPLARSLAKALKDQGTDVTYVEFPAGTHNTSGAQPGFGEAVGGFFGKVGKR